VPVIDPKQKVISAFIGLLLSLLLPLPTL